jgi:hypothetical protein
MRTLISTFLCLLFVSTLSRSQGAGRVQHPSPNATPIGSFRCTVTIGGDLGGTRTGDGRGILTEGEGEKKGLTASQIITLWSVSGGTDYTLDPDSLTFSGDGGWLEQNSAATLFDLLAKAAVAQSVALGYTPCTLSCTPGGTNVHAYTPSCVVRVGSSIDTRFVAQSPSVLCMREYMVCCPSGVTTPQVTPVLHEGTVCSGAANGSNYEPTCP